MSVTVTKAEGVTVFTVTSSPKSKWPIICQILYTLCSSPVCFVSRGMKQQLGSSHKVLGTLQIVVGFLNVAFGCITSNQPNFGYVWDQPYWLGGVFIAAGIVCIFAGKFPSHCLIVFSVLMNLVSLGLAITAIVLYSLSLSTVPYAYDCNENRYWYSSRYNYYTTTPSPEKNAEMQHMQEMCEHYKHILQFLQAGLDIIMITSGVLQLCVTISSCVLSLKALCKKNKGDQMEDSEKPLLVEEVLCNPAC